MPENHDELDGFDKRSGSNEHASFDQRGSSSGHADFDQQGGLDERGSFDRRLHSGSCQPPFRSWSVTACCNGRWRGRRREGSHARASDRG